jgi:hypothetical protein
MSEVDSPGHQDLIATLDSAGLELPPIPPRLEPRLARWSDWVWATRPVDPQQMYMFRTYVDELVREPVDDYGALALAGHGINSYGLTFQLVCGPLALFVQHAWGGAYTDHELAAQQIADTYGRARALVELVERRASRALTQRVVVLYSDFRGNCAHARTRCPPDPVGSPPWEHRGPLSGMGWFPASLAWTHHDDPEALFRGALAELTELLR